MLRPSISRTALLLGVLAPPLFVLVFLVDGLIHPAYNPVTDFVSELSRGELGWLQIANFLVFGAAILVFAAGIRWGARRRAGSVAGPVLFGVMGAGLITAGIFVTDAHTSSVSTLSGTIHNLASLPVFVCLIIACFVFARRFRGPLRTYSIASGIAVLILFVATIVIGDSLGKTGILQRATIVVGWAWITVLALALRAKEAPSETHPSLV